MTDTNFTVDPNWPKAPSGDFMFTAEVVNADGLKILLHTSGRTIIEAAEHAMREAAEEADEVSGYEDDLGDGEEFDDSDYDAAVSMAMDMTQSLKLWPGHHETAPTTEPVHTI